MTDEDRGNVKLKKPEPKEELPVQVRTAQEALSNALQTGNAKIRIERSSYKPGETTPGLKLQYQSTVHYTIGASEKERREIVFTIKTTERLSTDQQVLDVVKKSLNGEGQGSPNAYISSIDFNIKRKPSEKDIRIEVFNNESSIGKFNNWSTNAPSSTTRNAMGGITVVEAVGRSIESEGGNFPLTKKALKEYGS